MSEETRFFFLSRMRYRTHFFNLLGLENILHHFEISNIFVLVLRIHFHSTHRYIAWERRGACGKVSCRTRALRTINRVQNLAVRTP